jgi:rod shape-determining protein MreD
MPTDKRSKQILISGKHVVYGVLLLLFYILQATPRVFEIADVKPVLVLPFAIAIAMHEGEFAGGIYGAFAGLLCDMGGFALFGFNGFIFCFAAIAAGLLIIYMMQCNVGGCMLFVFAAIMIRGSIGYMFAYAIWEYENAWRIFMTQTLPTAVYTTAVTIPIYYILRAIFLKFEKELENEHRY